MKSIIEAFVAKTAGPEAIPFVWVFVLLCLTGFALDVGVAAASMTLHPSAIDREDSLSLTNGPVGEHSPGDTWGLPPTYIYLASGTSGDTNLYRVLKPGRSLRVCRTMHWRKSSVGWSKAALDPAGRWIVETAWDDSIVRKNDAISGSFVDYNIHRRSWAGIGCDSQYVYLPTDCYIYRFRLSDLTLVDSTRVGNRINTYMFGVTNDTIWVGDTLFLSPGYYLYPCSGMGHDSAHYVRFQFVGESRWTNPAWDGRDYYLGNTSLSTACPLTRFARDWTSHDDTVLPMCITSVMAVPRSPFYARDVGTIELRAPAEPVPKGQALTIRALIGNFGNASQGPFDVALQLSSQRVRKTIPSLNAGETLEIAFDPFAPESSGFFTLRCSTELAGDQDTSNDVDTFPLVVADFIQTFDSTSGKFAADPAGNWAWGTPVAPRPSAHSGDKVWGNRLDGDYANIQDSRLISCGFTATQDQPIIAFYQWYSIDSVGDGGNFSYKIDTAWSVLDPWQTRAYTGWINWMHAHAFFGDLFAWEKAAFQIPVSEGTPFFVSWRLGADSSRTSSGWIIDDVAGIGCVPNGQGIAEQQTRPRATLSVTPSLIRRMASISYSLPEDGPANLKLYDRAGRRARILVVGRHKAGIYTMTLDAAGLARGVYIIRLEAGAFRATRKLIVE